MADNSDMDDSISISGTTGSLDSIHLSQLSLDSTVCSPTAARRRSSPGQAHAALSPCARSSERGARPGCGRSWSGRRTAFVAGSISIERRSSTVFGHSCRDILLPRLPAPALAIIVPMLPPATRAALRLSCRGLCDLIDAHTRELTLVPDRPALAALAERGVKVFSRFPALQRATVKLPALPLSAWLVACGTATCLTSLSLHCLDVCLLEDLALTSSHPHLRQLDLRLARTGMPHASPPVVQFMISTLTNLRGLSIAWQGSSAAAAALAQLGGTALGLPQRRLFLDGRPRLGGLLVGGLADLPHLTSLELEGFLVEVALMARHWGTLQDRVQRLVLRQLHLVVGAATPPEEQLPALLAACPHLTDLHVEVFLPAAAAGADMAAAQLISLLYAGQDVRAVEVGLLPAAVTCLELPGVAMAGGEALAALAALTALTRLEVGSLEVGSGLGAALPGLLELRLTCATWQLLRAMLPWEPAAMSASPAAPAPPESPALAWPAAADAGPTAGQAAGDEQAGAAPSTRGPLGAAAPATAACAGSRLRLLDVVCGERLDHWQRADRQLVAAVARALLPLVDAGVTLQVRVAESAAGELWNVSIMDGWEAAMVWQRIGEAQRKRKLQADTAAAAARMARGRVLTAARQQQKEHVFVDR